jgi:DoxX-like protein
MTMADTARVPDHTSRWKAWAGIGLSTMAVLFLLFDSTGKLLKVAPVVAGTEQLGYPESVIRTLGVILLLCVITYVIPRFSIVGAVLLTGYLGGAIATHVRVGSPLLTHVLFPIYLGVFIWGGLLLRDARLPRLLFARGKTL